MPEGWDQWGLVGAMVLAMLGLFGWLLKTSYTNFTAELAAGRAERQELARQFAQTVGNHCHEVAEALAELHQGLAEQMGAQRGVLAELRGAIEELAERIERAGQ